MENVLTQAGGEAAAADEALETEQVETGSTETISDEGEPKPSKTFTQEELDAKLAKQRRNHER